jgi:hypothetical protein
MKYRIILYLFLLGIAAIGYLNDPTVIAALTNALSWLVAIFLTVLIFTLFQLGNRTNKPFITLFKIKFIEITLHCIFILFISSKFFAQSSPILSISIILCFYGLIMPIFCEDKNCLQPEPTKSENLFLFNLRLVIYNILSSLIIVTLTIVAIVTPLFFGIIGIHGIIIIIGAIFYKYMNYLKPKSNNLFLFSLRSVIYNVVSTLIVFLLMTIAALFLGIIKSKPM